MLLLLIFYYASVMRPLTTKPVSLHVSYEWNQSKTWVIPLFCFEPLKQPSRIPGLKTSGVEHTVDLKSRSYLALVSTNSGLPQLRIWSKPALLQTFHFIWMCVFVCVFQKMLLHWKNCCWSMRAKRWPQVKAHQSSMRLKIILSLTLMVPNFCVTILNFI